MEYEVKTIVEQEKVVWNYRQCDCCHRVISINNAIKRDAPTSDINKMEQVKWHRLSYNHNDWGHDSVDSCYETHYCESCLERALQHFMKDPSPTKHLEIETKVDDVDPMLVEYFKMTEPKNFAPTTTMRVPNGDIVVVWRDTK